MNRYIMSLYESIVYCFALSLCACITGHGCMVQSRSVWPPIRRTHSLHVWLNTSAIHDIAQSDVHCAEHVLMFVRLVNKAVCMGVAEVGPEIEMFHENIRMENHFTVKSGFIIALEEPRLVCSI